MMYSLVPLMKIDALCIGAFIYVHQGPWQCLAASDRFDDGVCDNVG